MVKTTGWGVMLNPAVAGAVVRAAPCVVVLEVLMVDPTGGGCCEFGSCKAGMETVAAKKEMDLARRTTSDSPAVDAGGNWYRRGQSGAWAGRSGPWADCCLPVEGWAGPGRFDRLGF
jgi:hypothetical protein